MMTKQDQTFSVAKTRGEDVSRIESWIKVESMQISIHQDKKKKLWRTMWVLRLCHTAYFKSFHYS